MVGSNKDTVQAALKELVERIGDAAGRKRQAMRMTFPGLGSLNFSGGGAKFIFEGSLAPKRSVVAVASTSAPAPSSISDLSTSSRSTSALHAAGKLTVRGRP